MGKTNKEIISFLSSLSLDSGLIQKLKVKYRPLVCPFEDLLSFTDSKRSAFDVGCGAGQFCALLAEFTDLKKIHGIEIDRELVNRAGVIANQIEKGKKLTFSYFDGKTIPNSIKKYDLVYMIDVYHHVPTDVREDMMKQIFQKMKRGAILVFKDIDRSSPLVIFNKIHDLVFAHEFGHEISFRNAKDMLSGLGYEITATDRKNIKVYPHYLVVARKS